VCCRKVRQVKGAWRAAPVALAAAMTALIAGWSVTVPAFEAPDEPGHFRYVQQLAQGRGLPVQGRDGDYDPEFSQPPLYYGVQAAVARLVPSEGAPVPDWDRHNPYQNRTVEGNVNLYSHPPSERFAWSGPILQLHVMRLVNLLFAGVTVAATYGIARETGLAPGLSSAAAGLVGLLPQFDFIAGALNADNAVTAFAALALWLLLRWVNRPAGFVVGALLGLAAGAAMLSKVSGLAVAGLVMVAMLWRAWRQRQPALALQAGLAGGVAAAGAGWWYLRNLLLYGDALGWQPMLAAIGAMLRPEPLSPLQAALALLRQWPTGIGVFGWNNLRLPSLAYALAGTFAGLAWIGLAGLVAGPWALGAMRSAAAGGHERAAKGLALAERRWGAGALQPRALGVLCLWPAVFAVSLVRWVEVNADAAQWRLLFPAFPAIAVLATMGLSQLAKPLAALAPAVLAGFSAASLLLVVRPAYMPQPAYGGPIQHQLNVRFGEAIELAGYDDPQPRSAHPGQPITLNLYWRALGQIGADDVIHLAGLDVANQPGLEESTWPQQGRAPTSSWTPGRIVRDRHVLKTDGLAPGVWNLLLDTFEPREGAPRLPVSTGGTTLNVGRFLILPPQPSAPRASPEASFGSSLALLQHTLSREGDRLSVALRWRVVAPLDRDYTVFVHALDGAGRLTAQNDSQPAGGRFPTSLLPAGTQIEDVHTLDLPPDAAQLEIGVYDVGTGARLGLGGDGDALRVSVRA
jgi:4-amino-4-deoxy-L-arabinose transferase-like glycosyltransferase